MCRPSTSDKVVELVRQSFVNSPTELFGVLLKKLLHLKPYRYSNLQAMKHNDEIVCNDFCVDMLSRVDDDEHFLDNNNQAGHST